MALYILLVCESACIDDAPWWDVLNKHNNGMQRRHCHQFWYTSLLLLFKHYNRIEDLYTRFSKNDLNLKKNIWGGHEQWQRKCERQCLEFYKSFVLSFEGFTTAIIAAIYCQYKRVKTMRKCSCACICRYYILQSNTSTRLVSSQ